MLIYTAQDELRAIEDPELRHRKMVELNVAEQCLNLFKTNVVQRALRESAANKPFATPRIHGLVYNPSEGILRPQPIDFISYSASLDGLYDLNAA
jgi:carbonic anhydrase